MPIIVITMSPNAKVVLHTGVLDEIGVSIASENKVTRDLPAGDHQFKHTIEGSAGASCGITITQAGATLASVDAQNHSIVDGEFDDSIPVSFTVA